MSSPEAGRPGCWQLADGNYLLQGVIHVLPPAVGQSVPLPGSEANSVITAMSEYYRCSPQGSLLTTYSLGRIYCLEDSYYLLDLHTVLHDRLCRLEWEWCHGKAVSCRVSDIVLWGLSPCSPDELPFDEGAISRP